MLENKISNEEAVFQQIAILQKRVFGSMWPRSLDNAVEQYVKYIHVEADEALRETNYKHHKKVQPIDMTRLKDEIADIAIYTFALAGVVFENYEEFFEAVQNKVNYNETRQDWEINQTKKE